MNNPQATPCQMEMDDGALPPDAEHVGQPPQVNRPPPGMGPDHTEKADLNYFTDVCQRITAMGMDMWKINFPDKDAADY